MESDSSDITEKDVQFLCGCGKCTLKEFLDNGCSNPTESRDYPLLDIKKISLKKKVNLISRLELEAEGIREEFANLTDNVTESLKIVHGETKQTVKRFAMHIASMQVTQFMGHEKKKEFLEALLRCETVTDVMLILLTYYISWFNHSLLGSIIRKFQICTQEYEKYRGQLANFWMLHIRHKKSMFEIPRNSFSSVAVRPTETFIIKIGVPSSNTDVKASIFPLLKKHVSIITGISVSSFELCAYNKGCIEITVGAPAQLLQAVFQSDVNLNNLLIDLGSLVVLNLKLLSISYNERDHFTVYRRECKVCIIFLWLTINYY